MYEPDLEEIESQLYSHVFHSTEDVDSPTDNVPIIAAATDRHMASHNRYFSENPKVSSPKFQNLMNGKYPPPARNNQNEAGYYSKPIGKTTWFDSLFQSSYERPFKRKRQSRKQRALAAKTKKQTQIQRHPSIAPPPVAGLTAHITLTDSEDDDSCIVVENNWPIVSVTESDDEATAPKEEQEQVDSAISNGDDVIFVEPVEVPCEVINLDEESDVNPSPEKEHVFNSPQTVKQIHQERSELLNTPDSPDSTSNDFINNCGVDLERSRFNFELHGTDFRSDDFSKNSKVNESCETESETSTTTDLNVTTIIQTAVFNEIDFPKNDLFDESNLEAFGNFIIPLRKSITKNVDSIQSSPICKSAAVSNTYFPDSSSSESDFDEQNTARQGANRKKLPDLSPMLLTNQITDPLEESAENCNTSKRKYNSNKEKKSKKKRKALNESNTQIELPRNKSDENPTSSETEDVNVGNVSTARNRSLMNQIENKDSVNETSENTKRKTKKKSESNQDLEVTTTEETTLNIEAVEADINSTNKTNNENPENVKRKTKKKSGYNREAEDRITDETTSNIEHSEGEVEKIISKKPSNETPESSKKKTKKKVAVCLETESRHTEEIFRNTDLTENESDVNITKNSSIGTQEGSKRKSRKKSVNNLETEDGMTNETVPQAEDFEDDCDKTLSKKSSNEIQDSSKRKPRKKSINCQEADGTIIEETNIETQDCIKRKSKKKSISNQETAENTVFEETKTGYCEPTELTLNHNSNKCEKRKDADEPSLKIDVNTTVNHDQPLIPDKKLFADNSQLKGLVILDETFSDTSKIIDESDIRSAVSTLNAEINKDLEDFQNQAEPIQIDLNVENLTRPALSLSMASVGEIQRFMSNDRNLWKILDSDKYTGRRPSGRRCNKCRDKGHIGIRCPKRITPTCFICGGKDHYEPRCSKKLCTQCGKQRNYFTTYCSDCFKLRFYQCTICNMMGHSEDKCPDLWRRYHLTTEEGPLQISQAPPLKPIEQQWCSACAQQGHLEFTCNYVRLYPPHDPRIQCYEDVLSSDPENASPNRSYDMMVPPDPNYNFPHNNFGQLPIFDLGGYTDFSLPYNNMLNNVPNIGAIADLSRLLLPYPANFAQNSFSRQNENAYQEQNRNVPPRKSPEVYRTSHRNRERNNKLSAHEQRQSSEKSPKNVIDHASRHDLSAQIIKATQLWNRKSNSIFFNGSTEKIAEVISKSLADLSKLSLKSRQDPVQFKKSLNFNRQNLNEKLGGYYKTLNMVLFGIYNLVDGRMHLSKLKAMKLNKAKTMKLNHARRQELMTSYAYIFGNKKNDGIDYNELLRRI